MNRTVASPSCHSSARLEGMPTSSPQPQSLPLHNESGDTWADVSSEMLALLDRRAAEADELDRQGLLIDADDVLFD